MDDVNVRYIQFEYIKTSRTVGASNGAFTETVKYGPLLFDFKCMCGYHIELGVGAVSRLQIVCCNRCSALMKRSSSGSINNSWYWVWSRSTELLRCPRPRKQKKMTSTWKMQEVTQLQTLAATRQTSGKVSAAIAALPNVVNTILEAFDFKSQQLGIADAALTSVDMPSTLET